MAVADVVICGDCSKGRAAVPWAGSWARATVMLAFLHLAIAPLAVIGLTVARQALSAPATIITRIIGNVYAVLCNAVIWEVPWIVPVEIQPAPAPMADTMGHFVLAGRQRPAGVLPMRNDAFLMAVLGKWPKSLRALRANLTLPSTRSSGRNCRAKMADKGLAEPLLFPLSVHVYA